MEEEVKVAEEDNPSSRRFGKKLRKRTAAAGLSIEDIVEAYQKMKEDGYA